MWRETLAVDAIGCAGPDESLRLEAHLRGCEGCRQEARSLQAVVAALGSVDSARVVDLAGVPAHGTSRAVVPAAPAGGTASVDVLRPGRPSGRPTGPRAAWAGFGRRTRGSIAAGVAAMAVAALVLGVMLTGGSGVPNMTRFHAAKTVDLSGSAGIDATVSLTAHGEGTLATIHGSGGQPGEVLTVSMASSSGRWWVAGSYRASGGPAPAVVHLTCGAPEGQITEVWVSDPSGRAVLSGYVR